MKTQINKVQTSSKYRNSSQYKPFYSVYIWLHEKHLLASMGGSLGANLGQKTAKEKSRNLILPFDISFVLLINIGTSTFE